MIGQHLRFASKERQVPLHTLTAPGPRDAGNSILVDGGMPGVSNQLRKSADPADLIATSSSSPAKIVISRLE
jgi:hypothetical protein